jgi:hypothetical protein
VFPDVLMGGRLFPTGSERELGAATDDRVSSDPGRPMRGCRTLAFARQQEVPKSTSGALCAIRSARSSPAPGVDSWIVTRMSWSTVANERFHRSASSIEGLYRFVM